MTLARVLFAACGAYAAGADDWRAAAGALTLWAALELGGFSVRARARAAARWERKYPRG